MPCTLEGKVMYRVPGANPLEGSRGIGEWPTHPSSLPLTFGWWGGRVTVGDFGKRGMLSRPEVVLCFFPHQRAGAQAVGCMSNLDSRLGALLVQRKEKNRFRRLKEYDPSTCSLVDFVSLLSR